ncbi:unnamed protein product [Porites lobata]|uniref:Uncharacterized protein n=1 Tax=Porites lobata TaxID=104759 RepID=A0ABN8Q5E8_9CNID|nr:unnamed protein product [Porites lobata]
MNYCGLEHIESGVFQSMKNLSDLNLKWNALTNIQALKGLEQLTVLRLRGNRISTIADRTFEGLKYLSTLDLGQNLLRSVPDLTGLVDVGVIRFDDNQIADITKLGKAGYIFIWKL